MGAEDEFGRLNDGALVLPRGADPLGVFGDLQPHATGNFKPSASTVSFAFS
jgi:hypothetical protein